MLQTCKQHLKRQFNIKAPNPAKRPMRVTLSRKPTPGRLRPHNHPLQGKHPHHINHRGNIPSTSNAWEISPQQQTQGKRIPVTTNTRERIPITSNIATSNTLGKTIPNHPIQGNKSPQHHPMHDDMQSMLPHHHKPHPRIHAPRDDGMEPVHTHSCIT